MTHITSAPQTASPAHGARIRTLRWGVPAAVGAAALSVISVYGDGTLSGSQQAHQEAVLPWIIAFAVVVSGLLFGLAVPRLLTSRRLSGWGLALGIIGIVALAAYWSGLPIVFGTAAVLAGITGRRVARMDGGTAKLAVAATVVGLVAIGVDVIGTIVSTYH
jgi:ABC-type transport system involved in multi-copper enzyme maturation permease subunit